MNSIQNSAAPLTQYIDVVGGGEWMVLVALHGGDWEGKHLETADDVRVSRGEDVRIKSSVCKTELNMSRPELNWMDKTRKHQSYFARVRTNRTLQERVPT
jgi:hypothetical protein